MQRIACVVLSLVVACPAVAAPTVKDDAQAVMIDGGTWYAATWATNAYGGAAAYGYGPGKAKYVFPLADVGGEGTYRIWVTWSEDLPGYPTEVTHNAAAGTVNIEASIDGAPPADVTIGGRPFKLLYEGPVTADIEVYITSQNPGDIYQFDAVAVERVADPPPPIPENVVIRDQAGGTFSGEWYEKSDWADGAYGGSAYYSGIAEDSNNTWYQQVFTAPASGIYNLQMTWPAGGSGYANTKIVRLRYINSDNQSLSYFAPVVNMTAGPSDGDPASIVANERQFQLVGSLIAVTAGTTIEVRVIAPAGKRIVADAMALQIVSDLAGNPVNLGEGEEQEPDPEGGDGEGGPGSGGPGSGGSGGYGTPEEVEEGYEGGHPEEEECDCVLNRRRVRVTQSVVPSHWSVSQGTGSGPQSLHYFPEGVSMEAHVKSAFVATNGSAQVEVGWKIYGEHEYSSQIPYDSGSLRLVAGRNGHVRAEWGFDPEIGSGDLTFAVPRALFDSLLGNPGGVPAHGGSGSPCPGNYQRLECVYSAIVAARVEDVLRRMRDSLTGGYQDFRDLIPRSADESFDEDGGGGGGGSGSWPTDGPGVDEGDGESEDTDGDGVPDYRDEDPNDSEKRGVKPHYDDESFVKRWRPQFYDLKDKFKNPFGEETPTLEEAYPEVALPMPTAAWGGPATIGFTLKPDEGPVGSAIEFGRLLIRNLALLLLAWRTGHSVFKVIQSW